PTAQKMLALILFLLFTMTNHRPYYGEIMRKRQTAIPLTHIFIFTFLLLTAAPVYAAVRVPEAAPTGAPQNRNADCSTAPDLCSISSLDDLVQWHNTTSAWNQW